MPWEYLLVAAIVFVLNLLPAFGPPTSAVLVALTLSFDLASVPLIASGAVAAACGRFALANGARRLRPRLSAERRAHLAAAEGYLVEKRARTIAGLGLFALSPVPSGQLFTGLIGLVALVHLDWAHILDRETIEPERAPIPPTRWHDGRED